MAESPSQDRILYQIKRLGPQTARSLGDLLEMTTMGIRQHLAQLEADGLVAATAEEKQGRGRPVRNWKLTAAGHARFPDAHAQVSQELIISVRDLLGQAALDTVIQHRTEATGRRYLASMSPQMPLQDRVVRLCELRTEEGYMAEWESVGSGYRLMEHHCPICVAARSCQGFCDGELELFQAVFEGRATVTREDHLLQGARRCSYLIRPG